MKINIMTLFPGLFENYLKESLIGKAIEKNILDIDVVNIRDYTNQKSKSVDDYVYGGGSGMLMMAQPIVDCHKAISKEKKLKLIIYRQEENYLHKIWRLIWQNLMK